MLLKVYRAKTRRADLMAQMEKIKDLSAHQGALQRIADAFRALRIRRSSTQTAVRLLVKTTYSTGRAALPKP